jgi:2-oxo-4-hydroxy-4-carboxy--5-ureidoimidazoline (OHCU) decarboxylase
LDQAIASALACGEWKELERLPTGAAKIITAHLLDLRARCARLHADLAGCVAVARAMTATFAAEPEAATQAVAS